MKNMNIKKIGFNFFFILITFIHVIKFESDVYSAVDFFYYPNLPTIELVHQPKTNYNLQELNNLSSSNSLTFKKVASNFFQSIAHKYLFKLSPFYIIQHFPDEQVVSSPTHKILTFLQNKNRSQSSDDDPFPGYWC